MIDYHRIRTIIRTLQLLL